MQLAVSAQDIRSINLAILEKRIVKNCEEFFVSPEDYLKTVDEVLNDWKVRLEDLESLILVTGPGSFTASRISTTIVNTIAFAYKIPIYPLENLEKIPLQILLDQTDFSTIKQVKTAIPSYDRPPHITQPK